MAATKVIKAASSVSLSDTAKNALVFTGIGVSLYLVYKVVTFGSDIVDTATSPIKNINKGVSDAIDTVKDIYEAKKKTAQEQAKAVEAYKKTKSFQMAFTPTYWQGKTAGISMINNETAMRFAKQVREGIDVRSFSESDYSKIAAVYRNTPSKASMMKIAVYYYALYKTDLWTDISVKMTNIMKLSLFEIIEGKKDFTKKS